jgi:hypothetical protein
MLNVLLEIAERMRAVASGDALGNADAGAIDEDARRAMGGFRLGEGRLGRGAVRNVADHAQAADRRRDRLGVGGVEIEHGDLDALGGQGLRGRPAQARAAARHDRRHSLDIHDITPRILPKRPIKDEARALGKRHINEGRAIAPTGVRCFLNPPHELAAGPIRSRRERREPGGRKRDCIRRRNA